MSFQSLITFLKWLWRYPAVRILISLVILAVLLANLPLHDLWATVKQVSFFLWVIVVSLFVGGHFIGTVKWNLLINTGENKLPYSVAVRCYFAGLFANLFLPSLAGGDVVRAGLAIRSNKEKEAVIFGSLMDRFLDVNSLVLFILIGALYSPFFLLIGDYRILLSIFIVSLGFACVILILFFVPLPQGMPRRLRNITERMQNAIKQLIRNPHRAVISFCLALVIQGGFVLLNALFGVTCNIHLALHIWFIAWPLAKLCAMLPVSMGGLGVREVALAVILSRFEVPFSNSVGLGLLWETVLIAGGGLGGLFYLFSGARSSKSDLVITRSSFSKDKI